MTKTPAQKTKKKFGCAILLLGGLYLFFFQLPYIVDPGLRDIHIRRNIKLLNAKDCEVIVAWCEKIYNEKYEELSNREMVFNGEIPEPASRVGYKNARLSRDKVMFRAGAGGFSQVGTIFIICFMDSEQRKAESLSLDGVRSFDPRTGRFDTPNASDPDVDSVTEQAVPSETTPTGSKQQDPEKPQP